MATYKTSGIILKRHNVNEADRILTVLTENKGKIRVIAKGVRRMLSKLGSHLEPFYLVDFVLAEGKNLDTITGAEVRHHYHNIREELDVMGRACRFGELVDVLTDEHEDQQSLFTLLDDCLQYLDGNRSNLAIDIYFKLNILALLGYRPELNECVICRGGIPPVNIAWSSEHGGLICERCLGGETSRNVSANTVKVLRLFLGQGVNIVDRLIMTEGLIKELENILNDFLVFIHQKELVSDKFLRSIREGLYVELARN